MPFIRFRLVMLAFFGLLLVVPVFFWAYQIGREKYVFFGRKEEARRIFFVETSGKKKLSIRAACSIESAVKWNPEMRVQVLMNRTNSSRSDPLLKDLQDMKVEFLHLDFNEVFSGTPLKKWYSGLHTKGPYHVSHMSDALRITVLWKYGGIYLDLDAMVLKPIYSLRNFIIYQTKDVVAAAIMGFEKHHRFMEICIKDFAQNYKPYIWTYNGPLLITRNLQKFCPKYKLSSNDCGIKSFTKDSAYKIPWTNWGLFFDPRKKAQVLRSLEKSDFTHLWNKLTESKTGVLGKGSAYEELMATNCPKIFSYVRKNKVF